MNSEARRTQLIKILQTAQTPVSGTELAERLGVSRQIIVQDIALLRATNRNILSTNKGYLLFSPPESTSFRRTFKVYHTAEQMEDELNTIVDAGGKVLDVVVAHEIYGQISVDLILSNRSDVELFMEKIRKHKDQPLNVLTNGLHFHTVEAASEDILDRIESKLSGKGYLAPAGVQ